MSLSVDILNPKCLLFIILLIIVDKNTHVLVPFYSTKYLILSISLN